MADNLQTQRCENGYLYVARIKVSFWYDNKNKERKPQSYSVRPGKDCSFKFAKKVFKKLIEEVEDSSLVELRLSDSQEAFTYGAYEVQFNLRRISEIYDIYVLNEDVEKIDTEPVRIVCIAEAYPDEKREFIKIFEVISR